MREVPPVEGVHVGEELLGLLLLGQGVRPGVGSPPSSLSPSTTPPPPPPPSNITLPYVILVLPFLNFIPLLPSSSRKCFKTTFMLTEGGGRICTAILSHRVSPPPLVHKII